MATLTVDRNICDETEYTEFLNKFRNVASELDTSNNLVGILRFLTTRIPNITLETEDTVIHLHIRYRDCYLLGLKVGNGDWYSFSKRGDQFPFQFDEAQQAIGFDVGYIDLGFLHISSLMEIDLSYHKTRGAVYTIARFSANPRKVNVSELQKSVAFLILSICEAARFNSVQREIEKSFMGTANLSADSVAAVKS